MEVENHDISFASRPACELWVHSDFEFWARDTYPDTNEYIVPGCLKVLIKDGLEI